MPVKGQTRDALERKAPQRRPQKRWDRWLEEVVKAVGGRYCRLQMPLKLALRVRETVAGHRLGALEWGATTPLPMHPWARPGNKTHVQHPPPPLRGMLMRILWVSQPLSSAHVHWPLPQASYR